MVANLTNKIQLHYYRSKSLF